MELFESIALIAKCVVVALFLYCTNSLLLVATQQPGNTPGISLDFSRQSATAESATELLGFTSRDGAELNYCRYGTQNCPLIVVVHGSSAHGGLYEELAVGLSKLGTIVVPDLRGHAAQAPAGDVNYIGQLEDDLADLIASTRTDTEQRIILVGHSSGGGLVVWFSGNSEHVTPDGAVLLAPYLGYNDPTSREDAGGWTQPLTRRIIGLTMLNAIGVRLLNHLPVITFHLPENGATLKMTESYSYRMNTSLAPRRNYKQDISSLPSFKIIVSDQDEAFLATEFELLLDSFDNQGSVEIVDGISHLDIISSSIVHEKIREFVVDSDTKRLSGYLNWADHSEHYSAANFIYSNGLKTANSRRSWQAK